MQDARDPGLSAPLDSVLSRPPDPRAHAFYRVETRRDPRARRAHRGAGVARHGRWGAKTLIKKIKRNFQVAPKRNAAYHEVHIYVMR